MVDNNVSETFNSWINEFRDRHITTLLEEIRKKVMTRIVDFRDFLRRWNHEYSPACMEKYETNFLIRTECDILFNGDDGYEVTHGEDQHTILLEKRTCTCRMWDISGIPCPHAVASIHNAKKNPLDFISNYHSKAMFLKGYEFSMQPVRGYKLWRCSEYASIETPIVKKQPSRPKKNRVRDKHEPKKVPARGKFPRKGGKITCGICKAKGHNKTKCKNAGQSSTPSGQPVSETSSQVLGNVESQNENVPGPSVFSEAVEEMQVLITEASKQSGEIGKKRNIQMHSKKVTKELARNYAKKRKTNEVTGLGLMIDERTGRTTWHESLSSRKVIDHGNVTSSSEAHIEEWSFRYAKSQKVNMQPKSNLHSQSRRKIQFVKDGVGPTDLPFKPTSDLRWKDKAAVTGAHLERTRQEMIAKQKENVGIAASQVVAPSQTPGASQISVVASQVSRASSYVSEGNSGLLDDGYAALK